MDGLELDFPALDLDAIDTPEETPETPEIVEETPETPELETPETPEGEEEPPADGRKVPDEVRKALKAFRDASPENAKAASALRDSYGRELAYKAIWPTVKDAQSAQTTIQTIESYGGVDGIQATIAEIEEVDQLLAAGDPKAIDKIFEVAGEGFSKIAPAMLDRLQSSNPEAYAAAVRPHLVAAIGSSGLTDAFAAVLQAQQFASTPGASPEFKAKWEKDASEGLQKIHQYLQGLSKEKPVSPNTTVAPDKLSERETAIAAREAQAFNTEVGTLANTKMNTSLAKAVAPYVKGLSQEARADYVQGVYDEVAKLAKADKNYQRNKDAAFKSKTKDAASVAKLMSAKFEEVVSQAAKSVASRRYGKSAPAAPGTPVPKGAPAPGGVGSVAKPILVKELPARDQIDFNKTDDDMMIRGIRVLKNGKTVKLDR